MIKMLRAFLRLRIAQLYMKKKIHKAIALMEEGIVKYPNYPFMPLHLGLAYTRIENWEKAEYFLQKACNLDPSNPVFDLFMGKALIDSQQYEKAIDKLLESIEKDKDNQLSWSYLALAYLGAGERQKFHDTLDKKPLSENHELQIRMILLLEKQMRNWDSHELQSYSVSE